MNRERSFDVCFAPKLKLDRAGFHIDAFNTQSRLFFEKDPYCIEIRESDHTGKKRVVFRSTEGIPYQIAPIVGDIVHNIRSALDVLIYNLALDNSASKSKLKSTYFPTASSKEAFFYGVLGEDGKRSPLENRKLSGLSDFDRKTIEDCEPFDGGKSAHLYAINYLDVLDKHKIVLPVANTLQNQGFILSRSRPPHSLEWTTGVLSDLKDGDAIMYDVEINTDQPYGITAELFFSMPEPRSISKLSASTFFEDSWQMVNDLVCSFGDT